MLGVAVSRKMSVGAAAVASAFAFHAPLRTGISLARGAGTPSFTRATTATIDDHDSVVRSVLSGEARFKGARRVQNQFTAGPGDVDNFTLSAVGTASAPVGTEGFTIEYGGRSWPAVRLQYALNGGTTTNDRSQVLANPVMSASRARAWSIIAQSNTAQSYVINLRVGSAGSQMITVTPTPQRFAVTVAADADNTCWLTLRGGLTPANSDSADILVSAPQVEYIDSASAFVPGEYVDPTLSYGANVNGVKYFDRHNGNVLRQNLVRQSAAIQTSWTAAEVSITGNTDVAPDGTLTAGTITQTAASDPRAQQNNSAPSDNQIYTLSVYVKKLAADDGIWSRLLIGWATGGTTKIATVNFNAYTGVAKSGSANTLNFGIESVGGYWRVFVTGQNNSSGNTVTVSSLYPGFNLDGGAGSNYAATNGVSRVFWGMQVNAGWRPATYVETAASTVNNSIVDEDEGPSISESSLHGFYSEGNRQNLCLQSEDFSTTWANVNTTETVNAVASPDGQVTADRIVETAINGGHFMEQSFVKAASAIQYTASVWLKAGERTVGQLLCSNNAVDGYAVVGFDLTAGTVTGITVVGTFVAGAAAIQSFSGGWYRVSYSFTTDTDTTLKFRVYLGDGASFSYLGDITKGFYAWGAQLEAAAFASSYIPTTTAAVTRNADILAYTGTSLSGAAGTLAATYTPRVATAEGNFYVASLHNSTTDEFIGMRHSSASDDLLVLVQDGGVGQASPTVGNFVAGAAAKCAMAWDTNSVRGCKDGSLSAEDVAATMPTVNVLDIGSQLAGMPFAGVKDVRGWGRKFSGADMQLVTR
jgi:hypothetical protein